MPATRAFCVKGWHGWAIGWKKTYPKVDHVMFQKS
jgi:hypothetical protein